MADESPRHVKDHVETVARHERDFLEQRTAADRLGDTIARFAGSIGFILFHMLWIGAWIGINTGLFSSLPVFDSRPFPLLATIVTIEAVFLASFILMRQNRMTRRTEERDHLMLQLTMLLEKEVTKVLEIERKVAGQMELEEVVRDEAARELSQTTSVDQVAQTLREKLP